MLMNSEIGDIRALRNISPTLHKDAAVQVLTWDNQWVAYDDAATFQLKAEFARSQCLGGVMVWAVSHDDRNGRYSDALSKVTKRPFVSIKYISTDSSSVSAGSTHNEL